MDALMKRLSLLLSVALSTSLPAASVSLRLSADKLNGAYQAFGTQSWFTENDSFFGDVLDNGFDFVVSYDTSTAFFNQSGSLGTQFMASIISGTIGSRNVADISNLSGIISIQSVAGSQPRQVVLFTAREEPFGTLQNGYVWNEVNFQFTDNQSSLSTTTLPDGATLLAAADSTGASVRNARGGNILATREVGNGAGDTIAAAQVPEPSVFLMTLLTVPSLLLGRRR